MSSISRRIGSTLAIISALGFSSVALAAGPTTAADAGSATTDTASTLHQKANHTKEAVEKKADSTKEAATKKAHKARRAVHKKTNTGHKGGVVEKAQDKASETQQKAGDAIKD